MKPFSILTDGGRVVVNPTHVVAVEKAPAAEVEGFAKTRLVMLNREYLVMTEAESVELDWLRALAYPEPV